ncbi:hypothetical protein EUX98_g5622 [Antrodiella citrinella]|uniref:Uncharacterized protein n=1 Tax=Antrodiella citrinella TaxID=2447956 RepID=A0A4S4MSW5_9APHY|nr:hypothetical protein EUX98_g5622 [Antrodiella citrinella]
MPLPLGMLSMEPSNTHHTDSAQSSSGNSSETRPTVHADGTSQPEPELARSIPNSLPARIPTPPPMWVPLIEPSKTHSSDAGAAAPSFEASDSQMTTPNPAMDEIEPDSEPVPEALMAILIQELRETRQELKEWSEKVEKITERLESTEDRLQEKERDIAELVAQLKSNTQAVATTKTVAMSDEKMKREAFLQARYLQSKQRG